MLEGRITLTGRSDAISHAAVAEASCRIRHTRVGECAIIQGILLGGTYAQYALGMALMFGVMRIVNIAHGDLVILLALIGISLAAIFGLGPFTLMLLLVPLAAAIGWLLQRTVLNKVIGDDPLPSLIATFGLSIALQNFMLQIWSADTRSAAGDGIRSASINIGSLYLGVLPLLALAATLVLTGGLDALLRFTPFGRSLRAAAADVEAAAIRHGVNPQAVYGRGHGDRGRHSRRRRGFPVPPVHGLAGRRSCPTPLCFRSGHHRRSGFDLGRLPGRDGARSRTGCGISARPGLGRPRRPHCLSWRARDAASWSDEWKASMTIHEPLDFERTQSRQALPLRVERHTTSSRIGLSLGALALIVMALMPWWAGCRAQCVAWSN